MLEELYLIIPFSVLLSISIIFVFIFKNKILDAKKEYESAKDLVREVVLEFKRRLEEQNKKVNNLLFDVENLQSYFEKGRKQNNILQEKIKKLTQNLTTIFMINKKMVNNLVLINRRIDTLKETDEELYKKLNFYEKKFQYLFQKPIFSLSTNQNLTLVKLTKTEKKIIQILISEGAKTAPEIMAKIGKTREHTSRLMKKLWLEGYIERDTRVIPFIYRPTKELEKRIRLEV